LNSPENRLRVLMVDRPLHPRIHLSRLSQEAGPPLGSRGATFEVARLYLTKSYA
jgi:hypothetical protein